MGKKSNLMHQAIKQLNKQKKFGESKFDAKKAARQSGESTAVRGIYSSATYNSYVKVCKQFITETLANHREVKNCRLQAICSGVPASQRRTRRFRLDFRSVWVCPCFCLWLWKKGF